jgi:hypothetical protein
MVVLPSSVRLADLILPLLELNLVQRRKLVPDRLKDRLAHLVAPEVEPERALELADDAAFDAIRKEEDDARHKGHLGDVEPLCKGEFGKGDTESAVRVRIHATCVGEGRTVPLAVEVDGRAEAVLWVRVGEERGDEERMSAPLLRACCRCAESYAAGGTTTHREEDGGEDQDLQRAPAGGTWASEQAVWEVSGLRDRERAGLVASSKGARGRWWWRVPSQAPSGRSR